MGKHIVWWICCYSNQRLQREMAMGIHTYTHIQENSKSVGFYEPQWGAEIREREQRRADAVLTTLYSISHYHYRLCVTLFLWPTIAPVKDTDLDTIMRLTTDTGHPIQPCSTLCRWCKCVWLNDSGAQLDKGPRAASLMMLHGFVIIVLILTLSYLTYISLLLNCSVV